MANQIHYELFIKRGAKGAWTLADAFDVRAQAIKAADVLIAESSSINVRVMKETYREETGEFLSLVVYEQGAHAAAREIIIKKEAELPCFQPEDLYSCHARIIIARLLEDYLNRCRITVLELMHRADLVEKLEATETELQHAVQKYAISHAGENHEPIHDVVRKLNDLVQKAIEMLYRYDRADRFPKLKVSCIGDVARKLIAQGNAEYCFRGSVAAFISKAGDWDQKLNALLNLLEALPKKGKERDLCLSVIDHFIAEILGGRAAMSDLLGRQPNLGASLLMMTYLFLGRDDKLSENAPPGVQIVSRQFAQENLVNSKAAIAQRIMNEIKGVKRLNPESLDEEVKLVRQLANLLVMGQGPMLPADQLAETFNVRSRRLVSPESVDEFLQDAKLPQEKISKFLTLEENIVGVENKRTLAAYVLGAVTSHQTQTFFQDSKTPILKRLAMITEMQNLISGAGFQPENKQEISTALDALAWQLIAETAFFEKIDRRKISPAQKAVALLRLCANSVLPKGECDLQAKRRIIKYLQMPNFTQGVTGLNEAGSPEAGSNKVDVREIKALLVKTGVEELMGATVACESSKVVLL